LLGFAIEASGGVITSAPVFSLPGSSTGSLGSFGATPAPNNDNAAAASPNVINYQIFFNSPGFAEVVYNVEDSGGTTEYFINQAPFLVNNSGLTWTGFRFELGFGTGSDFVPAGPGALDFDLPDADPAPFSARFPIISHQPQTIVWSGATVPSVGGSPFTLSIDVPDNLATMNPYGARSFTLRQTPLTAATVPEPASAILLLAGAGFLAFAARRHRAGRIS
jgi:hypothetical protein